LKNSKDLLKDLWLARITSLSNKVGLYVVLPEVLLFMPISWIIMDAVEDYARRWIKREVDQDPELESLSDWVRTIRSLVQGRIHKLKNCVV
jgi:peptidoglycan/LPS O-acetylase OafA/YrhL